MKKSKTLKSENGLAENSAAAHENFLVAGIGASAGGIRALTEFFECVAADSGVAYVVILHLSPEHESRLAEILQATAKIPVAPVTKRVKVEPNRVYVVPPRRRLEMEDGHLSVSPNVSVEERRAPVDIFFRTLAESHRERAIAVILSGTGADGSIGLKRIKERGGAVFAQTPGEAEFGEMPRNSIATEPVDTVLSARAIPAKIAAYKKSFRAVEIDDAPESRPDEIQAALREIFTVLRVRTKHDFSNYKRQTVLRRIERRINVCGIDSLPAYAAFINENAAESQALLKDLLISVTNFFRDKEAFDFLEQTIVPRLLEGKRAADQIRVWIAGCATGEEAYSLAMLLAERTSERLDAPDIQIFASDIDEAAIAVARAGFYTINDAADVSPARLHRFFTKEEGGYRLRRELREMVLFADHNLLKDPPFSHIDLVSCRNLLIYFNGAAQERALEIFHFALNPGSFLFLGTSETVGGAGDLYANLSREHHVYQSRQATARIAYPAPEAAPPPPALHSDESKRARAARGAAEADNRLERISFADLHRRLLEQYAPPSIVVNEHYDVAHLSESANRFLQTAGGEPSKNLLELIRPDLRLELRTALYQAAASRANVDASIIRFDIDGRAETVKIQIRPVLDGEELSATEPRTPATQTEFSDAPRANPKSATETAKMNTLARGFFLVLFESSFEDGAALETAEKNGAAQQILASSDRIARRLEEELVRAKSLLRSSIDRFEWQTEQLRAANEELTAMNEELRSSAEQLETSREELQSVNEELITVNQELKIKIDELSHSNSDFKNLMNSNDIGTVFLDRAFRVKMFTPSACALFNLFDADLNRPLADIATELDFADLLGDLEEVLTTLKIAEREVRADKNKWYLLRIFPYRTSEDKINGVVIVFIDITRRKLSEFHLNEVVGQLKRQSRVFDTTLSAISDFAYIFDSDGRFRYANQPLLDLLGTTAEEIVGKNFFDLNYPPDLAARLQKQIQHVFDTREIVRDETTFTSAAGEIGYYEYIFTPVVSDDGAVESVAGSTRDTTARRSTEEALRDSEMQMRLVVEAAEMGTWDWNLRTGEVRWNEQHYLLFGLEPGDGWVTYKDFERGVHPDDREQVRKRLEQAIEQGKVFQTEFRNVHPDGSMRWMSGYGRVVEKDENGRAARLTGVMFDATDRKQAESDLSDSIERLRLLVESASDYAIFTMTPDSRIDSWSSGAEKVFGWTELEALGQTGDVIFTPEDRDAGAPERERATALSEGRAPDERIHLRKDGSRFYASGVMTMLKDSAGEVRGFAKIARDMTELLAAEKAVRDKEMLQKMVVAQEDERKRIARDIHDQLGQQLTVLRLKLEAMKEESGASEIGARIDDVERVAKQIDDDVDFIAWELRPASLDDLGLRVSLDNYVKEWSLHVGVKADFLESGVGKRRFGFETETNFYRIAQEALNNTYKHARADRVSVLLELRENNLALIVEDDGVGFNAKNARGKGLGLIGMRERAAILGGTVEIESAKGKGTTVFVRVPLSGGADNSTASSARTNFKLNFRARKQNLE